MSEPSKAGQSDRPRFLYPEQATPEVRAQMARRLDVDGEAYLRWLAGEGPDPCPPAATTDTAVALSAIFRAARDRLDGVATEWM
jgi:hypothetical protein